MVQAVFIRCLPLEAGGTGFGDESFEIAGQTLAVIGIIDGDVVHAVAVRTQSARQFAHACEDGQNLLRVVQHVVGFLADFHQHVQHIRIDAVEPGMQGVELVTQQQADGVHAFVGSRRQRSEQYFT